MWRRIKPNHSTRIPGSILFLDTETRSVRCPGSTTSRREVFRLGVTCYVRLDRDRIRYEEWQDHTTIESIWATIDARCSIHRPLWVFAHNLAFDLTVIQFWSRLERREWVVSELAPTPGDRRFQGSKSFCGRLVLESRPCFLYTLGPRGRAWFVDTLNYYPQSLESLAPASSTSKQPLPAQDASDEEWLMRCRSDVRILRDLMLSTFLEWYRSDCGVWQVTAAGLSMTSWRHQSPTVTMPDGSRAHRYPVVLHDDVSVKQLERQAYHGGLNECLYRGRIVASTYGDISPSPVPTITGPVYVLDVAGMYPSIMRDELFPCCLDAKTDKGSLDWLRRRLGALGCIAEVLIESDDAEYPILRDDRLCYASGRFWTTLCGPELRDALLRRHIRDVGRCAAYSIAPIFRDWVDFWWGKRVAAQRSQDHAADMYAKMILNSLYGKFGQRARRWELRPSHKCRQGSGWGTWTERAQGSSQLRRFRAVGYEVQELVQGSEAQHSFPAISAFITSFGRNLIRKLAAIAGDKNVLHIATDALITTEQGMRRLEEAGMIGSGELGVLRLKGSAESGEVYGINHHMLGDRYTCAGSWGKSHVNDAGDPVVEQWQRIAGIIATRPGDGVLIQDVPITSPRFPDKRRYDAAGWALPLVLGDGSEDIMCESMIVDMIEQASNPLCLGDAFEPPTIPT